MPISTLTETEVSASAGLTPSRVAVAVKHKDGRLFLLVGVIAIAGTISHSVIRSASADATSIQSGPFCELRLDANDYTSF